MPTICTVPPPKSGVWRVGEKKGKIDVYILLRESSCRRLLAAAANLLVLVTLLVDGEILARGGRGKSAEGTRGASERERKQDRMRVLPCGNFHLDALRTITIKRDTYYTYCVFF